MKVIIMRGLPGSGKTSWVTELTEMCDMTPKSGDVVCCSADHYHIDPVTSKYKFQPTRIKEAHDKCLKKFLETIQDQSLRAKVDYLVVDNTNTTAWEIAPYYRLAEIYEVDVEIVSLHCTPRKAAERNIHDVPATTLLRMANNLNEPLPERWNVVVVWK